MKKKKNEIDWKEGEDLKLEGEEKDLKMGIRRLELGR